jgi:hypothetical protein
VEIRVPVANSGDVRRPAVGLYDAGGELTTAAILKHRIPWSLGIRGGWRT